MESQEEKVEIGAEIISNEPPQGKAEENPTEIRYPHKGTLCLH